MVDPEDVRRRLQEFGSIALYTAAHGFSAPVTDEAALTPDQRIDLMIDAVLRGETDENILDRMLTPPDEA